jgi:type I restriction enzyme R subunit
MELVKFIRTASGLDRKAVMKQFEEFLQDSQLSSNQIGFIDQMIEFYTQKGHLDVANLYEPPFNFIDENGIEGVFNGQGVIIDILVNKVRELNDIKTA